MAKKKSKPGATSESRYNDLWLAFLALGEAGEASAALARLRADQKDLAVRLFDEGLKWDEFPGRTGLPKSTVRNLVPIGSRRAGARSKKNSST